MEFLFSLLVILALAYLVYGETGIWTAFAIAVLLILCQKISVTIRTVKERLIKLQEILLQIREHQGTLSQDSNIQNSGSFSFYRGSLTVEERELAMRGINGDLESLFEFLKRRSSNPNADFQDVPVHVLVGVVKHICDDAQETEGNDFPEYIDDTPPN